MITGITIGDYVRNRRLSIAGQELLRSKEKIINIALKYGYETPVSFTRAFKRFHGISPSEARIYNSNLRSFSPFSIQINIKGGFDMSRKIIDNIPIHQLQYPEQGQNYVFNGCMKFLMECIGEKAEYDYWFFSCVSGDCYVQVYGTNKDKWHTCFSQSKFDYALIKRVFDAIGYDFTYVEASVWTKEKSKYKSKIMEYIDKGIPVIGKGFYSSWDGNEWPTDEVSCIIGYENDGECFFRLPEEATNLVPFSLDDERPYTFVFIEQKKVNPDIAYTYRKALMEVPNLMKTPPNQNQDVFFANDAFEQWANMLEDGFYHMSFEEYSKSNSICQWRYYTVYICIIATNLYSKQFTTDRAFQLNPDLAAKAYLFQRENQILINLENQLKDAGGDFNITYETLQDAKKCKRIAGILREFKTVNDRICNIIEQRT